MTIHPSKKQLAVSAAIVGVGLVLALLILFARPAAPEREHTEVPVAANADTVRLTDAQIKAAGITILRAAPATIHTAVTLPGEIRFNDDRTAQVVPLLGGTVQSVQADLGQAVRKGQILAQIASPELAEQRSALLTAERRLAGTRTTYAREKALWEEKISAEQDLIGARQAMQEAEIAHNNALQKLRALGSSGSGAGELSSYALRAPFDGVVVEKHIALGQSVKTDSVLFIVSDLATVWADVAVPAGDLGTVRVGQHGVVKASAFDAQAKGTVAYIGSLLGAQSRTATARIVLANPGAAWRPGMFVNVDIETAADGRDVPVTVHPDAVHTVEDKPTVFVRVPGGFTARHITVGRADATHVEARSGLAAGQAYAAEGSFVIKAELGKSPAGDHH
jgi:cobalt-zinc-cadmium efflux system membrane fusion protein